MGEDGAVTAIQWNSINDPVFDGPRAPTFRSTGNGELTLSARGEVLTGTFTATMVSSESPEDTAQITARFNAIPYTYGSEVEVLETTGAVAALEESMPDDPLVNFLSPARATVDGDRLTLMLGKFGPNIELEVPADHSGTFTAGPDAPATLRFAGFPVTGEGRLAQKDGRLSGEITAAIAGVDQIDGAGGLTVRFAEIPAWSGRMIRALLIALALPAAAHAQAVDSVYSTHDWGRDCRAVETDAPPDEAGMGGRLICPGPGEMHVMLSEGDMRMSMDYGRAPRFGPWESFRQLQHGARHRGMAPPAAWRPDAPLRDHSPLVRRAGQRHPRDPGHQHGCDRGRQ